MLVCVVPSNRNETLTDPREEKKVLWAWTGVMNFGNLVTRAGLQGGLRGSSDGALGTQNDQARYLQDSCNSVKRNGFHMQQAIVRPHLLESGQILSQGRSGRCVWGGGVEVLAP